MIAAHRIDRDMVDRERFITKIDQSAKALFDCHPWIRYLNKKGYGRFCVKTGFVTFAQRVSYALAFGLVPEDMLVLHKCDNRRCVNPFHLFLGTNADNMQDMVSKGRGAPQHGALNGNAKLTEDQVRYIRSSPLRHCDLGRELGVSGRMISWIRNGTHWGHVT